MDRAVYVIFSATPTVMGGMIRHVTRNRYNHVSLAIAGDMDRMFTFARIYHAIPLYGGFVVESALRYQSCEGRARVKICRIPVEEPALLQLNCYTQQLWLRREEYIYNTLGALASLLRVRITIAKTHTCVTFVQEVLSRWNLAGVTVRDVPTVRSLERRLEPFLIYEGPAPTGEGWGEDLYPQETTIRYAVYTTARHFGRLARRGLLGG